MKSLKSIKDSLGKLGTIDWDTSKPSRIVCRLKLNNQIIGVEEFVFLFYKSKSNLYHSPIWRKDYFDKERKTVNVVVAISKYERSFFGKCLKLVNNRINNQIKGRNVEMMAFGLFSTISEIDYMVGRPRYLGRSFRRYDLQVPVKSARSKGHEVLVPVQIKSGLTGQLNHQRENSRIPSVVVSRESLELLIEPCREMLHRYVNEGRVLHVHVG